MKKENQKKTVRKTRSTQLTDLGINTLKSALLIKSQSIQGNQKLTRELKAALLDLSVITSDKLLTGKCVDKSTAIHAFNCLGLEIEEGFFLENNSTTNKLNKKNTELLQVTQKGIYTQTIFAKILRLFAGTVCIVSTTIVIKQKINVETRDTTFKHLVSLSESEYMRGNFTASKQYLTRATNVIQESGTANELSVVLRQKADLLAARGELQIAKYLYTQILDIKETMNQRISYAALHDAIAEIDLKSNNNEEALKHIKFSIENYRKDKDIKGVLLAHRNYINYYINTRNYRKASQIVKYCKALNSHSGSEDILADIRTREIDLHIASNHIDEAEKLARQNLAYWSRYNHERWLGITYLQLLQIEKRKDNTRNVQYFKLAAIEALSKAGDNYRLKQVAQGG